LGDSREEEIVLVVAFMPSKDGVQDQMTVVSVRED
jgi:hypothetical protein